MNERYHGVITRFLRQEERLILSKETEMPLVIEADGKVDVKFLQEFLKANSSKIIEDMARYGAILLRGFNVTQDEEFEKIILAVPEFNGINEAFMSENGRVHVDNLKFVLHTNSVYKTGGTLYLGGFHTENYYSPDVPGYLFFCCFQPSELGGETGLINTQKIYSQLSDALRQKLEKNAFFVGKWSVAEVAERYQITVSEIKTICERSGLPMVGEGDNQFILMYKPSVFQHPLTSEKALQINMFELHSLNRELRKCFMQDYKGKAWFWHRFLWKLPTVLFNSLEFMAVVFISFFHSPKNAYKILSTKLYNLKASRKATLPLFNKERVMSCFNEKEIKELAQLMREYYSSCLWRKGDLLLIDNKKVMHAGMPGKGSRLVRAMISNPIEMRYSSTDSGLLIVKERATNTIGSCMVELKRQQS